MAFDSMMQRSVLQVHFDHVAARLLLDGVERREGVLHREAYRAEDIDPTTVQHLTLATKKQQVEWLKLFTADDARAPTVEMQPRRCSVRGVVVYESMFGNTHDLAAAIARGEGL